MVGSVLRDAVVSAVNWSEVIQKGIQHGWPVTSLREQLQEQGLRFAEFDFDDGERTGKLWPHTKAAGLSLGDRACLALAQKLTIPAITADTHWNQINIGVTVEQIR